MNAIANLAATETAYIHQIQRATEAVNRIGRSDLDAAVDDLAAAAAAAKQRLESASSRVAMIASDLLGAIGGKLLEIEVHLDRNEMCEPPPVPVASDPEPVPQQIEAPVPTPAVPAEAQIEETPAAPRMTASECELNGEWSRLLEAAETNDPREESLPLQPKRQPPAKKHKSRK